MLARAASTKPRPPSSIPKKRLCSSGLASSVVALIRADQNVSPAAKPQPIKIKGRYSADGNVENHAPIRPANNNEKDIKTLGDILSANQPLGT